MTFPFGLSLAIAAALPACGNGAETSSSSRGGSAGSGASGTSTPTPSTGVGGSGGDTLGTSFGGSGATSPSTDCDPAPSLDAAVALPVPDGVTADFAARGRGPVLSMAPGGDGAVVFQLDDELYIRRRHAGAWAAFERLAAPAEGVTRSVLSTSDGGRVVVVYTEHHATHYAVCARTFDPASGWSGIHQVAFVDEGWWQDPVIPAPSIAMSSGGDSMVAWTGSADATGGVFAQRFSAAAGWGDVESVSDAQAIVLAGSGPSVALHDDGSAVVAWTEQQQISARDYQPGSGWGTAVKLASSYGPVVLAPGTGQSTVAAWSRLTAADDVVETAVLSPGAGWSAAEQLGTPGGSSLLLATSTDGGRAIAWSTAPSSCDLHGHARVYPAGGPWAPAAVVPGLEDGSSRVTGLGIGDAGRVAMTWGGTGSPTCGGPPSNLSWLDPVAGVWQTQGLDLQGSAAQVSLTHDGHALLAWERSQDPSVLVRFADPPAP